MTALFDEITPAIVEQHGFTPEEYEKVLSILGRTPNHVELGIFSVMWSEHCSYKSTRKHIKKLPTTGKQVICGPGENAGVVDIGDGQAAIFKMESHNHPSFIEPYQGAATGVGGIMRDVFTMGARPVALLNALRFGELSHPKTRYLINGVVSGIAGYGNCMGVPTVGGECTFDKSYNSNNLVNAMCVGIADANNIFYSAASAIGAQVIYAGSETGRDGIHGATMASAEFDETLEEKRPTVQVGDPFMEKRVMEACLELMTQDAIMAIQDMGAAGLTCSSLEMADKGDAGIELNLDKVPMREENMSAYEIMLSESQERMLMVIEPGKEHIAKAIFDKWEVPNAIIGRITDTKHMVLIKDGQKVADLPVAPTSEEAPVYDRPWKPTPRADDIAIDTSTNEEELLDDLKRLLATPDLCSKRWIWQQYDHMVMNDTIERPGGDAAVVRVHGSNKGLALTSDCTPRYCLADPVTGGKQAVAEAWRNITATGAKPLAITNCLNFGNPEKPEIMGQIVGCLAGMAEACTALDFPVVSGNASLYNETYGEGIQPTPTIGGVGLLNDISKRASLAFANEGDVIIRIGDMAGHLGGSLYLQEILGLTDRTLPPEVNLELEKRNGDFVRLAINKGWVTACHDVSDGGQLVALAEMAIAGKIGATVDIAIDTARAFGEDQARYIITAPHDLADRILTRAPEKGVVAQAIGEVGGTELILGNARVNINDLEDVSAQVLPSYMNAA